MNLPTKVKTRELNVGRYIASQNFQDDKSGPASSAAPDTQAGYERKIRVNSKKF